MADPRSLVRRLTVVVADDEPVILASLRRVLEEDGHRVLAVTHGEAALDACRSESIDVVVLDVRMPGIDGLEVAERLRSDPSTAGLPIVFCSGSLDCLPERLAGSEAGKVALLAKPFDAATFRETVAACLRRSGP